MAHGGGKLHKQGKQPQLSGLYITPPHINMTSCFLPTPCSTSSSPAELISRLLPLFLPPAQNFILALRPCTSSQLLSAKKLRSAPLRSFQTTEEQLLIHWLFWLPSRHHTLCLKLVQQAPFKRWFVTLLLQLISIAMAFCTPAESQRQQLSSPCLL